VARRDLALVELLLQANCPTSDGTSDWPPLFSALASGRIEIVRRLVSTDALLARTPDGNALHCAIMSPNVVEMLDFVLDVARGVDVDAANQCGWPPLLFAASTANKRTSAVAVAACERLLAAGANVFADDGSGETALHFAARNCDTALMELFLARGCDANARDKAGMTPLAWLCTAEYSPGPRLQAAEWLCGGAARAS
jgi:ankyrin repeat protein